MIRRFFEYSIIALSLPIISMFVACEETDYMKYDTSLNGVYFTKDTLNYSFGVMPVEIRSYEYKIPVRVMGGISSEARPVKYIIVDDSTTAVENVHYRIKESVIFPDSIDGHILVEILRDNLEGVYPDYTRYKLGLQLQENNYFTPTLDAASQMRVLSFDNSIEQPDWLDWEGNKVWQEKYLGKWHPYKFIKMVEYFHAIENILPETYKDMVEAYGENLEHIPYGDPSDYRTIFVKYIYTPMYEFFNDEANRDMILSLYSDFIFDFPSPY